MMDEIQKLLETEKSRISFMENVIKGLYQQKVVIDPVNGTVTVNLTPSEVNTLIDAESKVFDLRRRVNGILD